MNWWMLAGGLTALICAVGHAFVGSGMFYRPIRQAITNDVHAGVQRLETHVWSFSTKIVMGRRCTNGVTNP
jgi:hypothetical protein